MTIIQNGTTTNQRKLTVNATISRLLETGQELHLFRDSIDLGAMTKDSDFAYHMDVPVSIAGETPTNVRYLVQARHGSELIANSPLYEITFSDPLRSEIVSITEPAVVGSFILMEDGTPMLLENGTPILTEIQPGV